MPDTVVSIIRSTFLIILLSATASAQPTVHWPVGENPFEAGRAYASWVQPTVSGEPESALFGCVRNNGHRFHEGLDIAPVLPRRRGEAVDPVHAVMDGRVAYINRIAGNSGYGRYVIIEHTGSEPAIHTLYAHLASIEEGLEVGAFISGGSRVGLLGRSAGGYSIPRSRAHLHLEFGVRLSDAFQGWFDRQDFGSANHHGIWNGLNLVGFDPHTVFQQLAEGRIASPGASMRDLPAGVVLRVTTPTVPDFVKRYPALLARSMPEAGVGGWEVTLTGWGLPIRFDPLDPNDPELAEGAGTIEIVAIDPGELDRFACRQLVVSTGERTTLGKGSIRLLQLLFGLS